MCVALPSVVGGWSVLVCMTALLSIILNILVDFSGDHLGMSADLVFAPCDSEMCHTIPINDDMIVEQLESFFVTLTRPEDLDNRIMLHSGFTNKEVTIIDNDSKYIHVGGIFC